MDGQIADAILDHQQGNRGPLHGLTYLVCRQHRSRHCPGRGVIKRNGRFTLSAEHTHIPNMREPDERSFRRELYHCVTTQPAKNRQIYERIRPFHGNATIGVPFTGINTSMHRWRNKNVPPFPDCLRSYVNYLNMDQWNHLCRYEDGSLQLTLAQGREETTSVIILDPKFARDLLENGDFFIHISEKAVPTGLGLVQLLSIMRLWNDSVIIPCTWALMGSDTEEAYTAVFQEIKRILPEVSMQKVVLTYVRDLHISVRQEFPEALIYGSLFHFHEEIYKRVVHLNLDHHLQTIEDAIRRTLLNIMALPLLPAAKIEPAFNFITDEVIAENRNAVQEFFIYFQEQWMEVVQPRTFSVSEMMERLTDAFELYGSRLECKVGTHPEVWTWTKSMVSLQQRVFYDKKRIDEGFRDGIQSPKLLSQRVTNRLRQAWARLNEERVSVEEFLTMVSYICVEPRIEYLASYLQDYRRDGAIMEIIGLRQPLEVSFQSNDDSSDGEDASANANPPEIEAPQRDPLANQEHNIEGRHELEADERVVIPNNDTVKCCICRQNTATHAFVPCGHQSICAECASVYQDIRDNLRCPVCRAPSQMTIRIFI